MLLLTVSGLHFPIWILILFSFSLLQCQLGVLPLGTGNDLARVLGWGSACDDDTQLPQILEKLERASTKMLDRWVINTELHENIILGELDSALLLGFFIVPVMIFFLIIFCHLLSKKIVLLSMSLLQNSDGWNCHSVWHPVSSLVFQSSRQSHSCDVINYFFLINLEQFISSLAYKWKLNAETEIFTPSIDKDFTSFYIWKHPFTLDLYFGILACWIKLWL